MGSGQVPSLDGAENRTLQHASTGLSRHVVEELQLTYVLMNWTDSCPPCPHLIYPGLGPTQMLAHSCVHSFLCVFQAATVSKCMLVRNGAEPELAKGL